MKKILGQFYGYSSVNKPDPSTGGAGGTLQNYTTVYTVPSPSIPDTYSDKIYTECAIYVYPCIEGSKDDIEMKYNIRIIKEGDAVDPRMVSMGGSATNADEAQDFKFKPTIIDKPSSDRKDYPKIYDNIMLETGDKIVVQTITQGISIQIFGEELQYDTDAHFKMKRDGNINLINKLEERKLQSNINIPAITTAIGNIAACTP